MRVSMSLEEKPPDSGFCIKETGDRLERVLRLQTWVFKGLV